jgi:hypothetical protein
MTMSKRSSTRWPDGPELTDRDVEILKWITTHGVVTAEFVGRRFFWRSKAKGYGKWAAYRRLAALEQMGLVKRDKIFVGEPAVIRVTKPGAELADVGLRPARLILSELRHTLAVVVLAEGLQAQHKGSELTTERQLRAERYRRRKEGEDISGGRCPDCLLSIPTKSGKRRVRVAVELDLSRKSRPVMESIVHAYDQEPDIDEIWWYTIKPRVKPTKEVVKDLAAENRFEVREWQGPT